MDSQSWSFVGAILNCSSKSKINTTFVGKRKISMLHPTLHSVPSLPSPSRPLAHPVLQLLPAHLALGPTYCQRKVPKYSATHRFLGQIQSGVSSPRSFSFSSSSSTFCRSEASSGWFQPVQKNISRLGSSSHVAISENEVNLSNGYSILMILMVKMMISHEILR